MNPFDPNALFLYIVDSVVGSTALLRDAVKEIENDVPEIHRPEFSEIRLLLAELSSKGQALSQKVKQAASGDSASASLRLGPESLN